ncbi:MAG: peptidoglycan-binding protein [Rubellimicrobium sp.]|nr:peptidoglycan-binding protein [Rubellimicrobium sp.]
MRRLFQLTVLLVASALPLQALARDAALILGNERYEVLGRISRAADVTQAADGLAALGFAVSALPNGRADSTAEALAAFLEAVPEAERIVVALSGRFVTDGRRSWFLTAEADAPGILSLGTEAVSLDALMTVLAGVPGQALLILGVEVDNGQAFDRWLSEGLGPLDIPQGVTVIRGRPRDVSDFMTADLLRPAGDLTELVARNRRIAMTGFTPRSLVFMPGAVVPPPPEPQEDQTAEADRMVERALWEGAVALDTIEAYRNYLRRYPVGAFAAQAEAAIEAIRAEPFRAARIDEDALDLSRDKRRDIQRKFTLLGYNTGGIDGIFGPMTRGSITNWQQQNGLPQTGYLTAEQIARLDAQAARRSAELEAEAERQRQTAIRADRAFWDETGALGTEAGLRAYLGRYPDGIFAEEAAATLALLEERDRQRAQVEERQAWDRAREVDTVAAYRTYLRLYPEGQFRGNAQARIVALTPEDGGAALRPAARVGEEALNLNAQTRRLVEQRLADLGLEPGAVDGTFDNQTRRAIRNYQRDHNLPATGFLDETVLVRLLAETGG